MLSDTRLLSRLAWLIPILLAFLAVAPPAEAIEPEFDEKFEQSHPLAAGGTFSLTNINGSVRVDGWEKEEVWIQALKTAKLNEKDLAKVRIEVHAQAGSVAVRTVYPQDQGVEVAVEYKIRVPHRVLLGRVETVNGSVTVRGVEGAGDLRTVNGNVEVLDSEGRFSARATNGNLRVELAHLPAGSPMTLQTTNGAVVLVVAADADADLEVDTLNGDFQSEIPVTAKGSIGPRAFKGRLGNGGSGVRISTLNGAVRIVTAKRSV